jgi:outer membrane protein TolC
VRPSLAWHHAPSQGAALTWPGAGDAALDALLALAESRNRELMQAALRLKLADVAAAQAQPRVTPSAGGSLSLGTPLDQPQRNVSRSGQLNLALGWEADLWGRLGSERSAAAAQQRAVQGDLRAARLSLRSRVAALYWQAAATGQQEPLTRQQQRIATQLLEATRLRVREGKLAPIEIDRAAMLRYAAELRLEQLRADAAAQRVQLALLLDEPLPGPLLPDARLPAELPAAALPDEAPAAVLERRPDVQRARAQVDAALQLLRAREAARYPALSFSAGVGASGQTLRELFSNPLASLAANLAIPLIDWRRLDLQRELARTDLELAALQLRETVAAALAEIETAWIDDERLRQQLAASAKRLHEARQAERHAALRLEVGTVARTDLLAAQTARLDAEQNELQLRLDAWLQRLRLTRALAL